MSRKPKYPITAYSIDPDLLRREHEVELKEKLTPLYNLVGKTVVIRCNNMTTPPFDVCDIQDGRDVELGRIVFLVGATPEQKIPVRVPDILREFDDCIELVYESKFREDDKEVIFKATRSDRRLREDTVMEILIQS
jgi:hypothetical protein